MKVVRRETSAQPSFNTSAANHSTITGITGALQRRSGANRGWPPRSRTDCRSNRATRWDSPSPSIDRAHQTRATMTIKRSNTQTQRAMRVATNRVAIHVCAVHSPRGSSGEPFYKKSSALGAAQNVLATRCTPGSGRANRPGAHHGGDRAHLRGRRQSTAIPGGFRASVSRIPSVRSLGQGTPCVHVRHGSHGRRGRHRGCGAIFRSNGAF